MHTWKTKFLSFIFFSVTAFSQNGYAVNYPPFPLKDHEFLIEGEAESVQSAVDTIKELIEKRHDEGQVTGRGDHGKSHGCYDGTFRVYDRMPDKKLHFGISRKEHLGKIFQATVRISNSDPKNIPDAESTSQGMALKVYLPQTNSYDFLSETPNYQQDFLLSTNKEFLVSNITEYAELFDLRTGVSWGNLKYAAKYWKIIRDRKILPKLPLRSPPEVIFKRFLWSELPYSWGPHIAKYRVNPCALAHENDFKEIEKQDPDYQRAIIEDTLKFTDLCYELAVQLRPENATEAEYPVEDAKVPWNTRLARYLPIGKLIIAKNTKAQDEQACEGMVFSPWNALAGHRPLGNLGRSRLYVYRKSMETRKALYKQE